jgi:hypothetical protein
MNKILLGLAAATIVALPAVAGQVFDSTTVGSDTTLSDGAGTTGPGMSGDYSMAGKIGTTDSRAQMVSSSDGKTGANYRVKGGFSRRAIYNNQAELAQPHIR